MGLPMRRSGPSVIGRTRNFCFDCFDAQTRPKCGDSVRWLVLLSAGNTVRTGWFGRLENDIVEVWVLCKRPSLWVSERHEKQGGASVSTLTLLLMLNAIVFLYDRSKTWWRENVAGRVARRRRSLDA